MAGVEDEGDAAQRREERTTPNVAVPDSASTASTAARPAARPRQDEQPARVDAVGDPAGDEAEAVNGKKRQNASAPTASGECESSSTSHASATFCIHDPETEITWPVKKM